MPPSIGQVTTAAPAPLKTRGEDQNQNGKERYRRTTPPVEALHTDGYMGLEATEAQIEIARRQYTRLRQPQQQVREVAHLAWHRSSDG